MFHQRNPLSNGCGHRWMKCYEAISSRDEAMDAAIKTDDRGKRELLEQIIAVYQQQDQLLVRLVAAR